MIEDRVKRLLDREQRPMTAREVAMLLGVTDDEARRALDSLVDSGGLNYCHAHRALGFTVITETKIHDQG